MKEPVDHIIRPSLPWRGDIGMTECGYDASKVKAISRQEFFQRVKDLGQQRCAMLTCMTCSDTAKRWGSWQDDPRAAIAAVVRSQVKCLSPQGETYRASCITISGRCLTTAPDKDEEL